MARFEWSPENRAEKQLSEATLYVIERGWGQMTAMRGCYWKSNRHISGIAPTLFPYRSICSNVTFLPFRVFSISIQRVMILLGINSSKSFLPRLERWELASSSFRRELEPFYRDLGSGQGWRHVSHAAHHAATINDRRVIKVGQCPYYIARDIKFCDHRSGAN